MTETLSSTDLPLTSDGWTAELLSIDTDDESTNPVGGDIQVGAAPSFRARFVSPDGHVLVMTQYAYVVAYPHDDATNLGLTPKSGPLANNELADLLEDVAERHREGLLLGTMVHYHYDVVSHIDLWGRENLDPDQPDFEYVKYEWDLGSEIGVGVIDRAEGKAREFIREASTTIARDLLPGSL